LIGTVISGFLRFCIEIRFNPELQLFSSPNN
jgi:hypothetical protein